MKFYQKHKRLSMWFAAFIFVAAVLVFKEIVSNAQSILSGIGYFLSIISPFIAGFIIAFVLYAPCNKLELLFKKVSKPKFISKHARGFSVLSVYLFCAAALTAIIALVIPWVIDGVKNIYEDRETYYIAAVDFIESYCDENGKVFGLFSKSFIIEKMSISYFAELINADNFTAIASGVYKAGAAVIDSVLAVFSSIYMLLGREKLVRSVGRVYSIFVRRETVTPTKRYFCKIADIFYSYMYSTLLDALIVSVLCTVAFLIIGVKYALLFGILIGVSNLIPYFGAIIAGVGVSLFVALSDNIVTALITAVCILVIQQLDCNVLQPRIVGKSVGLKPLFTLIAITVGGGLFGVGGILLGVPVFATISMVFNDLAERHYKKIARQDMDKAVEDAVVEAETEENKD